MKKSLLSMAIVAGLFTSSTILPAFAATDTTGTTTSAATTTTKKAKKAAKAPATPVDPACMAKAAVDRDTAIAAGLQTVVTAIQTRGSAESTAWTASDKAGVKAAAKAFDGTWKTFNTARKAAWAKYMTDAKTCHASTATLQTPSSSGM